MTAEANRLTYFPKAVENIFITIGLQTNLSTFEVRSTLAEDPQMMDLRSTVDVGSEDLTDVQIRELLQDAEIRLKSKSKALAPRESKSDIDLLSHLQQPQQNAGHTYGTSRFDANFD
jgi:hypothetical protein